jgi:pimeloyl-ACP methyl ester carboxylesterase
MITYRTVDVDGTNIFYREAGRADAPVLLLLHGWPASSHMFRGLMPLLADRLRLIAPDYPGFGFSDAPSPDRFAYTFDHLAEIVERFIDRLGITKLSLYVQDYGGPIGFRIAAKRPELIRAIIVQNAIAHLDGVSPALAPLMAYWENRGPQQEAAVRAMLTAQTTTFQYLHGAANPERISPDGYTLDQALLDRPGNDAIQLELLYDYRNNPARFAEWQAYLQGAQPPMLVVWGRNDPFFTEAGAQAFARDNPRATVSLIDGGHFVLEEAADQIAREIRAFADRVTSGAG